MNTSSTTSDDWQDNCPFCGQSVVRYPSPKVYVGPCPHCGNILWYSEHGLIPALNSPTDFDKSQTMWMPNVIDIPDCVVDLMPESVARESCVIPLAESTDELLVAFAAPIDFETVEKLRFILNRRVLIVPASQDWIERHLDKHYQKPDGI